ncbi:MAG: glycosyltransferase family 4 protein [Gammaproteobacteria bacterium]|nr:glycosyltransferase family 4 protein [Gammaproteobacteria bacterium]
MAVYYDITDVVNRASFSHQVSGIQRVVVEGLRRLKQTHPQLFFISRFTEEIYVVNNLDYENLSSLDAFARLCFDADWLFARKALLAAMATRFFRHQRVKLKVVNIALRIPLLNFFIQRIVRNKISAMHGDKIDNFSFSPISPLHNGDVVAIFGGVWDFQQQYQKLLDNIVGEAKVTYFIHDLIPLVSTLVPTSVKERFIAHLPFVIESASCVITSSENNKKDLLNYMDTMDHHCAVETVGLSHKFYFKEKLLHEETSHSIHACRSDIRRIVMDRFALTVCSIEPRKNHRNLLVAWDKYRCSEAYGCEKLVIAGHWERGFEADDLKSILDCSGYFGGTVWLIERPSDYELFHLYKNCHFTLYLSLYEGWGLPIGESLDFTKPVIALDNSCIGEVSLGAAQLFKHNNYAAVANEVSLLFNDSNYYAECIKKVSAVSSRLRSWQDFGKDVEKIILNMSKA